MRGKRGTMDDGLMPVMVVLDHHHHIFWGGVELPFEGFTPFAIPTNKKLKGDVGGRNETRRNMVDVDDVDFSEFQMRPQMDDRPCT